MILAVGTYTRTSHGATGIYTISLSPASGRAEILSVTAGIENPSWQMRHPDLPVLYSVVETADEGGGAVVALSIGADGALTEIARHPTMGADPCHLSVAGNLLFASNYGGGSLAALALDAAGHPREVAGITMHSGNSVDPVRQKSPHVHSSTLHANHGTLLVCDLGLDKVYRYPVVSGGVDVNGRKTMKMRPGAGPRMVALAPDGRYAFVINELDNTIVTFDLEATDRPVELDTVSTLPSDFDDASYCAHLALSRDGQFLYASNRGHDSIATFGIGPDGTLEARGHVSSGGHHPRFFCLTPEEDFMLVANRDSNNIVVMARDPVSGALEPTGAEVSIPAPVCLTPLA